MPRIPEYEYQLPPRDAPDVQQSLRTSSSMLGGDQALEAWGDAVGDAGDAIGGWVKPKKEKTAAETPYPNRTGWRCQHDRSPEEHDP